MSSFRDSISPARRISWGISMRNWATSSFSLALSTITLLLSGTDLLDSTSSSMRSMILLMSMMSSLRRRSDCRLRLPLRQREFFG